MLREPRAGAALRGVPGVVWVRLAIAGVVGLAAVLLIPEASAPDGTPPLAVLVAVGFLVGLGVVVALTLAVVKDLRLPVSVAIYVVAFNALVVGVKFVLAPYGIYETNQRVPITAYVNITDGVGAVLTALSVFSLYALVFRGVYRAFRGPRDRVRRVKLSERVVRSRKGLVVVVAGALLVVMSGAGIVAVVVPLFLLQSGFEYLGFVFGSAVSLGVALALAAATVLASLAFKDVSARASVLGDAWVLATFFWVGLCFLALYHVLWVVYILVLTSIWPLKVVIPK